MEKKESKIISFLKWIFMPKSEIRKSAYILTLVFIFAFYAFFYSFPSYWNKPISLINEKYNVNIPKIQEKNFSLGLDLQGGSYLIYQADMSRLPKEERRDAIEAMRNVIERRVNIFGVSESNVYYSINGDIYRIIVELPGVKNIEQAIDMIGQTPYLEFRKERPNGETDLILQAHFEGKRLNEEPFLPTKLNGKYLNNAEVSFDQNTSKPVVNIYFNSEGAKIFEELTKENLGKRLAIYLDGKLISAPVVQSVIPGGSAVITGNFTLDEAKQLMLNLKAGALPVPIQLVSQTTVNASLGKVDLQKSLQAGLWAFALVGLFVVLWYRIPGLLALLSLFVYASLVLFIFKFLPVTLTLAGIAGFILSIGMAVDANILIFERMREEFRANKPFSMVIDLSFKRAWPSIRDSNLSTMITAVILYFFTTSLVKGFALTLFVGVLVSMFSAVFVTRLLLKLFSRLKLDKFGFLWYK